MDERGGYRLAYLSTRISYGLPISPNDYEWLKDRFKKSAPDRTVSLGTESAARRAILG